MGEQYFAEAAGITAVNEQYGPAERIYEDSADAAAVLANRYDIAADDARTYWEDVLGAALLEQDRLDAVDEHSGDRYGWALDRSGASGPRLAFTSAATAVDGAATYKFVPAFTDSVLTVQDAAGGAVAVATLLAGGVTAWMLHDLHEQAEQVDNYVKQFEGVAAQADERIEEQYTDDVSGAVDEERYRAASEVEY